MRLINIVLFSSGITENNGILNAVEEKLEQKGYNCIYWRDLFAGAHDMNNIAILPMLIKKIPTFDFAVLICEGHDRTFIQRNGQIEEANTMRDNVLFEIGLCVMALGLPRTILLTDAEVRMPDDLTGMNDSLAVKRIIYDVSDVNSYNDAREEMIHYMEGFQHAVTQIDEYIHNHVQALSPVIIGAAASTACGYVGNFIFRTLEKIDNGLILEGNDTKQFLLNDHIYMHIVLPRVYSADTPERAFAVLKEYQRGSVPDARMRRAEFRYQIKNEGNGPELHIYDYPTTLVTSYNTAKIILNLDADDENDLHAEKRFVAKELDLFEATLKALLNREYIENTVRHYYRGEEKGVQEHIIKQVDEFVRNRVTVERKEY